MNLFGGIDQLYLCKLGICSTNNILHI